MDKIEAAIFDMDGTILDSMPMWMSCAERYVSSFGIEPENGLSQTLFSMTMNEGAAFLKRKYSLPVSENEIIAGVNKVLSKAYAEEVQFKDGAEAFLKKLQGAGTKIALFTNTDRVLFAPALERLDAEKYFDFIFTTSEMKMSKAHSEAFLKVCTSLKTAPEKTWVFEDALYAIKTASLAGLKICALYDETSACDAEEIKKLSTVYCNNYKQAENYFFAK